MWRHKYYGKYAAQPRRMREGKWAQEAQKRGELRKRRWQLEGKEGHVQVKDEKTEKDTRSSGGAET